MSKTALKSALQSLINFPWELLQFIVLCPYSFGRNGNILRHQFYCSCRKQWKHEWLAWQACLKREAKELGDSSFLNGRSLKSAETGFSPRFYVAQLRRVPKYVDAPANYSVAGVRKATGKGKMADFGRGHFSLDADALSSAISLKSCALDGRSLLSTGTLVHDHHIHGHKSLQTIVLHLCWIHHFPYLRWLSPTERHQVTTWHVRKRTNWKLKGMIISTSTLMFVGSTDNTFVYRFSSVDIL